MGARTAFSSVPALVDRQEEVKRIAAALEDISKGNGQLLLFRGEGGCGVTRLVQEAVTMAEGRGFAVGSGTELAESVIPTLRDGSRQASSVSLASLMTYRHLGLGLSPQNGATKRFRGSCPLNTLKSVYFSRGGSSA